MQCIGGKEFPVNHIVWIASDLLFSTRWIKQIVIRIEIIV